MQRPARLLLLVAAALALLVPAATASAQPRADAPAPSKRPAAHAEIQGERIAYAPGVLFVHGTGDLTPEGRDVLVSVARVIDLNPKIARVRIEYLTSTRGSSAYNMRLSQARADAIRAALIQLGVAASRLEAVGMGEDQSPNGTKHGYAVFHIAARR